MPVTNYAVDPDHCTVTITAEFAAPVERVWQVYADPSKLKQVWSRPRMPAQFSAHALVVDTQMPYVFTDSTGGQSTGYWMIKAVSAPNSFEFVDAFTDPGFEMLRELVEVHNVYAFAPSANGGTNATYTSTYPTIESLDQVMQLGVKDGAQEGVNEVDKLLAAG